MTELHDDTVLDRVRDVVGSVGAGTVFGEPIVRGNMVVLPVAKVNGGGGGGSGSGGAADQQQGSGSGGGVGFSARPLGVYLITDQDVTWRPAIDVTKIAIGGQIVAVAALLVIRALVKGLGRRRK
jgi:uncharacterized spore protein YtfJ